MSVVKRIIKNNLEKVAVDELLADEYDQAGYGGIALTKTPLGTQINLFAMKPGRVIGKRGRAIKDASERLERELNITNPQITVIEVEVPELNPKIMAERIANALERGVHYRRSLFWSINRTMESGALGCEIVVKGPLRSNRGRFEKVSEGYVPKSGDPALRYVKKGTVHVKMKKGTIGVTVSIVQPDAKFPDKINLDYLPVIEYPEEDDIILPSGVEPDLTENTTGTVENISILEQKTPISKPIELVTESRASEEQNVSKTENSEPQKESDAKKSTEKSKEE
jgi:small subunit ribosomal protein S3